MAQSNVLCTLLWGGLVFYTRCDGSVKCPVYIVMEALVFYTRCDGSVKCPVYIVMGSFSFLYKM